MRTNGSGCVYDGDQLQDILCRILLEFPNPANWSEYPNVDFEVDELMGKAPWFHIYDFAEELHALLAKRGVDGVQAAEFADKINLVFRRKGVGWQLVDGQIQMRGPEIFEQTAHAAVELAAKSGREVARHELQEALQDLSRRPKPELTGAVQHAMAALECIARDVTGDPNLTLGEWLKKNPQFFPQPLGTAVEKLWGYAAEYGRHIREGRPATYEEVEMVVGIAGSLSVYLLRKS